MKRLLSFLVVFCLLLSCCSAAFAAAKPAISLQPVSQTVKAGGSASFKIKATNFTALTWYFVDPLTGEKISARHITEKFSSLRVKNPNGRTLTLKKIPEAMHGWTLYCHLVGNGFRLDSDTVMILIKGKEPPADVPAVPAEDADSSSDNPETPEDTGTSESGEEESSGPIKPFTVTVSGELELYELSRSGKPAGEPQTTLSFEESASFYVKANGYIQYLLINDLQLTPTNNVTGMTIRGVVKDTVIQGRVIKASAAEEAVETASETGEDQDEAENAEENPAEEENPEEAEDPTEEENPGEFPAENEEEDEAPAVSLSPAQPTPAPEIPADTSNMVLVTCERCRFSGGGNSFATSGYVPIGTTITVVCGSEGNLATGYNINGTSGSNKGQASFKLTVEEDTTISMQKRP